jgi:Effector protein
MINEIPTQPYGRTIVINGNGFLLAGQDEQERAVAVQKAQQFQTDTLGVLRGMEYIKKRQTAILLLAAINDGCPGKTLTIVPHRKQDGDARTFFNSENRATAKGEDYFDARYGRIVKGQGTGTSAVIEYDPWQYMNSNCFQELSPFRNDPLHQFQADDVLFHEMVHALRIMLGLLLHRSLNSSVKVTFASVEEFFAVMLTDIYVSECGGGLEGMRADHSPEFHSIQDSKDFPEKGPTAYAKSFDEPIKKLVDQMPDFTRSIGNLRKIAWNPLHSYFHPPQEEFEIPGLGGMSPSWNDPNKP